MLRTNGIALLLAAALLGAAGTAPARAERGKPKPRKGMLLPAELATGALELKVTTHKRLVLPNVPVALMLEFGPYRVTDFSRGWIHGGGNEGGFGGLVLSGGSSSQRYSFRFASADAAEGEGWTCTCASTASGGSLARFSGSSEISIPTGSDGRLACELARGEGAEPWRLQVHVKARPGLILKYEADGSVTSGERSLIIRGTDRYARTPSIRAQRITGFVLSLDGRPIGAADLAEPALLTAPEVEPNLLDPLAVASAALLLYDDLTRVH